MYTPLETHNYLQKVKSYCFLTKEAISVRFEQSPSKLVIKKPFKLYFVCALQLKILVQRLMYLALRQLAYLDLILTANNGITLVDHVRPETPTLSPFFNLPLIKKCLKFENEFARYHGNKHLPG